MVEVYFKGKNIVVSTCGYGSIPINTIFSGMNIHLPAILIFTRGTRFWHTAIRHWPNILMVIFFCLKIWYPKIHWLFTISFFSTDTWRKHGKIAGSYVSKYTQSKCGFAKNVNIPMALRLVLGRPYFWTNTSHIVDYISHWSSHLILIPTEPELQ